MDSGSTSYCVYSPGNISPSRPPLRRAAPEQARSGFPFLIGMAALVLAVGVGSVARFCPQDLRLASGGKHTAMPTAPAATAPPAPPPVIMPTTFTTVGSPAEAAPAPPAPLAPAKKKNARTTRRATSPASSSSTASTAASATPALPDNPYPQASPPETYGF